MSDKCEQGETAMDWYLKVVSEKPIYGWGISLSVKDLNGNWTRWIPPGSFFSGSHDFSKADVPTFFRIRRTAENWVSKNRTEKSRYKVIRYQIAWWPTKKLKEAQP